MSATAHELWTLVLGRPQVDPDDLAAALSRQVADGSLDFRTRLLARDAIEALRQHWGEERLRQWMAAQACAAELERLRRADLGPAGFPSLGARLMQTTRMETILQFLREIGSQVRQPSRIDIGGSIALILAGVLSRHTEDIDVVDEVPRELREEHDLLRRLSQHYGLQLAHFQSHYLPTGWKGRLRSLDTFGQLSVYLVDPTDIFLGKLFSAREKDRDDLRAHWPQLDRQTVVERLRSSAGALLAEAPLRQNAEHNWYILSGDKLPA